MSFITTFHWYCCLVMISYYYTIIISLWDGTKAVVEVGLSQTRRFINSCPGRTIVEIRLYQQLFKQDNHGIEANPGIDAVSVVVHTGQSQKYGFINSCPGRTIQELMLCQQLSTQDNRRNKAVLYQQLSRLSNHRVDALSIVVQVGHSQY